MKITLSNSNPYSFRIQIEPLDTNESISLETLLKVFNKLKLSFRSFVEARFLMNPHFCEIQGGNPAALDDFKKKYELVFAMVNIESLRALIVPDFCETEDFLFQNEILQWKKKVFNLFKMEVLFTDYLDLQSVNNICLEYKTEQRKKIYKPLFDIIAPDKNYKILLLDSFDSVIKVLTPPPQLILKKILSDKTEFPGANAPESQEICTID